MKKKLFAMALLLSASPALMAQDCSDIVWGQAVLDVYPNVADACDEVVVSESGEMYAKVNATFHRITQSGAVTVYVQENDGDRKAIRFTPPAGSTVLIDGNETPWRILANRQELRFYIPSDRFELLSSVEAAPMMAEVTEPEPEPEPMPEPEPEPEPMPMELPTTAANTGAWLLGGMLLLIAGLGMGVFARRRG